MRNLLMLLAVVGCCLAKTAKAYEYGLQFTPNSGARGLVVAGYTFVGNSVVGNCSYHITYGGSGKGGGGGGHTTYFDQTCAWDLYGNLLGIVQGQPVAPPPLSTANGLIVYAQKAQGDTTGIDTAHLGSGFVNTPSAQYQWVTQPSYVFLPNQNRKILILTLTSIGDFPLVISGIDASARLAKASVKSTTCQALAVTPGKNCSVAITYDPTGLPRGDDPYTAYDTLTVGIVSNSGQAPDFSESIEVPVGPGG